MYVLIEIEQGVDGADESVMCPDWMYLYSWNSIFYSNWSWDLEGQIFFLVYGINY